MKFPRFALVTLQMIWLAPLAAASDSLSLPEIGGLLEAGYTKGLEQSQGGCQFVASRTKETSTGHRVVVAVGETEKFLKVGDLIIQENSGDPPDQWMLIDVERDGQLIHGQTACIDHVARPTVESLISALKANDAERCVEEVQRLMTLRGRDSFHSHLHTKCLWELNGDNYLWRQHEAPLVAYMDGVTNLKEEAILARFADDPISAYEAYRHKVNILASRLQSGQAQFLAEELLKAYERELATLNRWRDTAILRAGTQGLRSATGTTRAGELHKPRDFLYWTIPAILLLPILSGIHAVLLGMAFKLRERETPRREYAFSQRWKASLALVTVSFFGTIGVVTALTTTLNSSYWATEERSLIAALVNLVIGLVAAPYIYPRFLSAPEVPILTRLQALWAHCKFLILWLVAAAIFLIGPAIIIPLLAEMSTGI